jgi:hypothetical protein
MHTKRVIAKLKLTVSNSELLMVEYEVMYLCTTNVAELLLAKGGVTSICATNVHKRKC